MPIYEYHCEKCDKTHEVKQPFDAGNFIMCPDCGKKAGRIISKVGGFNLKGPGFFRNDYPRR